MDTAGVGRVDFVVNGTNGNDTIDVSGDASGVAVSGLAEVVSLRHQQPTDNFDVNDVGGNERDLGRGARSPGDHPGPGRRRGRRPDRRRNGY
jgi:hypothetical protein